MTNRVAVVGMACQYPDAGSPVELWENALAQRRAFRRIPPERLRIEDYYSTDPSALDSIYTTEACLLDGYEFDRVKYRVAKATYSGADLAHWLALDVASESLEDAGFPNGQGLPKETTGVLVGNTLTGEFSRANTLRLRWPYVRRVVESSLIELEWPAGMRLGFLKGLERRFKEPFAPMNEETLAGNLSNTIAGRICNHFDLKGSGYAVDAACASSLLAIANSCSALIAGDLDVAVAGGVDLSIDPFELVGFARAGALARGPMLVYDEESSGFLPGEGCGFVVLMRYPDAVAERRRIYATIAGWGVSSDGAGGITRPESDGQLLALQRAYKRAGFGVDSVAYFEGHGTGTSVGDATELKTLSEARRSAGADVSAAIGSIKASIGHTKAAAGVAGFIKATMALQNQIIPPTTACEKPHPELRGPSASLRVVKQGERWPLQQSLRAGVSAMGFGGINTHVVIEGNASERRGPLTREERAKLSSAQDAELLLLGGTSSEELGRTVAQLLTFAGRLSYAELGDLAGYLASTPALGSSNIWRAAIVASTAAELETRLRLLMRRVDQGVSREIDTSNGVFIGAGARARIGFLFPGQSSPVYTQGGALERRFGFISELYSRVDHLLGLDPSATDLAQPAIVTAEIAALRFLEHCGISAELAIGHSVGEIAALHWAGAIAENAAIGIASTRGRIMAASEGGDGRMVSVRAGREEVEVMLRGTSLVVACVNSAEQTVVSGAGPEIDDFAQRSRRAGLSALVLPVYHAFHSPIVAPAVPAFREYLSTQTFRPLKKRAISTVTGCELSPDQDLPRLLGEQIVSPVLFASALSEATNAVDLFIEAGPGGVLSGIVNDSIGVPAVAVDAGGPSLTAPLKAVAAAYVLGVPINTTALFIDRFTRPFELGWSPRFFVNPCELAPVSLEAISEVEADPCVIMSDPEQAMDAACETSDGILELLRGLVAERTELPAASIQASCRLLRDLHLNSITVSQIVAEAARRLTLTPPVAPTDYSAVSIADIAAALDELRLNGRFGAATERVPPGVDSWIRCFRVDLLEDPLRHGRPHVSGTGEWRVIAPPDSALGKSLLERLAGVDGNGIAVVLGPGQEGSYLSLLLEGSRAALLDNNTKYFLLVQHKTFGAAFVRTLHLEAPWVNCCVVEAPPDHPKTVQWVLAELASVSGFVEAKYDNSGVRRIPALRLAEAAQTSPQPALGHADVILVSGGGKGIAAECALALARQTGARLAIFGRSSPDTDAELDANLRRLSSHGIEFRYYTGDVTDRDAVLEIARRAQSEIGPITAIVHGAGLNRPKLVDALTDQECLDTVRTKVDGARNLLDGIDPSHLRLFVTFGSLIARTGMRGEAHYALANELLRDLTDGWQTSNPHCRALCIEWSVWAGPGMGQRLGALDALVQDGINPISLDQGVEMLSWLLLEDSVCGSIVVTGRFGDPPTVHVERPALPFSRFLEHTKTYYPGVELVVEVEISALSDPYIADHVFQGAALFPAVMGLEAMAQAAMALAERQEMPVFEDVEFNRAIVASRDGVTRISISALARSRRTVEVVIRSDATDYQVNHFRALCKFDAPEQPADSKAERATSTARPPNPGEFIDFDPLSDLYGRLLFHQGRFVRVSGYYKISATECVAEITERESTWFGPYLPRTLVLGCPGRRDAVIHAIQVCVPDTSLLPVGVAKLEIYNSTEPGPCRVMARECHTEGDVFFYDVEVIAPDGDLLESWEGLRLKRLSATRPDHAWPLPLLAPYLERLITDMTGVCSISVVLSRAQGERPLRSESALRAVLGYDRVLVRRPDGKPELIGDRSVSTSHRGEITIAVAGPSSSPLACDIESVQKRSPLVWKDLLGEERYRLAMWVSQSMAEDANVAATRIWTAMECLRKCGAPIDASLTLSTRGDGSALLRSANLSIVTVSVMIQGPDPIVIAVLTGGQTGGGRSVMEYEVASIR